MLKIPRGAEREYLLILGVAAVYVAVLPNGAGWIGVSRDLHQSLLSLQRRFPGAEIDFSVWVKDRNTAEAIRHEANIIVLPSGSRFRLQAAIEVAAFRLDIVLTSHEVVMARVEAVVQKVEDEIELASQRGELAWFNRAYRQWRLQAKLHGRVMPYTEARARLRRAVILHGLAQRRADELLPAIFPDVTKIKLKN